MMKIIFCHKNSLSVICQHQCDSTFLEDYQWEREGQEEDLSQLPILLCKNDQMRPYHLSIKHIRRKTYKWTNQKKHINESSLLSNFKTRFNHRVRYYQKRFAKSVQDFHKSNFLVLLLAGRKGKMKSSMLQKEKRGVINSYIV